MEAIIDSCGEIDAINREHDVKPDIAVEKRRQRKERARVHDQTPHTKFR